MIARFFFCCLALFIFTLTTRAEGTYQRTRDDKTVVWNNDPKPGDSADWNGERDADGYADGFGTLTWYSGNGNVYARFYGNMVHGKFDGPVNVHTNGKTAYTIFIDGKRATRWQTGRAPSQQAIAQRVEKARERLARKERAEPPVPNTEAPRKKAVRSASQLPTVAKTASTITPALKPIPATEAPSSIDGSLPKVTLQEEVRVNKPRKVDVDESLNLLARPPSSLGNRSTSPASSKTLPRGSTSDTTAPLTKENVVEFADARARAAGYDPANYNRPKAEYSAANANWSLVYDRKASGVILETPARVSVTIDDKAKRTVVVPGP